MNDEHFLAMLNTKDILNIESFHSQELISSFIYVQEASTLKCPVVSGEHRCTCGF